MCIRDSRDFFLWLSLAHCNSKQLDSLELPKFEELGSHLDEFNEKKSMSPNDLITKLLEDNWGYLV